MKANPVPPGKSPDTFLKTEPNSKSIEQLIENQGVKPFDFDNRITDISEEDLDDFINDTHTP